MIQTVGYRIREESAGYGSDRYGGTDEAGRVRVLDEEVARGIAAGEVIERPAAAVKELVENSLDAGASRVEVEIAGGGTDVIRVHDDGVGMFEEDAALAVTRHATSKIRTGEDLSRLYSLGFRGEALYAIGAVSAMTLTTARRDNGTGFRVGVLAGSPDGVTPAARTPGTTVEVRDLFLNLPLRRGFLGTPRSEANAIALAVQSLALSRPEVGFWLRSEGRGVLALPPARGEGHEALRERVAQVHGLPLAKALIPLDDPVVGGLISPLSSSFPTRRYLHVTVNGRRVEADDFAPAVARAYADLLPKGRHPAAFLRLDPGPAEVDVNVHPAKSSVRLRGGRSAYPLVVGAIRAALSLQQEGRPAPDEEAADTGISAIGQFSGRVILAQHGEELLLLDQHGVHERVLYERLSAEPRRSPERLPEPLAVSLPPELAPEAWSHEAELYSLGFEFEPFGETTVRLSAAPQEATEPGRAFQAALEALAGGEDLAKALACKGSTKFGERLSGEEMDLLIKEWTACEFPMVCPHGRPIMKRISLAELLREFGRG
ncbi:DNA mismatch repair endonuclease MutL [Rubrobacter aplysinae]|uniref:DNA mismatch repair endonuclease MutL n=1 Tax=Rubrobacter aplysinae TaxID=909625 RepID=UPI00069E746B|nr:DNA mismatch repair endonuclease MutL [Rubrobacter aplysinae]